MVDKAENVKVQVGFAVDLDDVLFPVLAAARVFDDGDAAVERVEPQQIVELQAFTPRSFIISAIRTYMPFCTCSK